MLPNNEHEVISCLNALLDVLKDVFNRSTGERLLVVAEGWPSLILGVATDAFHTSRVGTSEDEVETEFYRRFERWDLKSPHRTKVVRIRRKTPGSRPDDTSLEVTFSFDVLPEFGTAIAEPAITCALVAGDLTFYVVINGLPSVAADAMCACPFAGGNGSGMLSFQFPADSGLGRTLVITPHRVLHDGLYRAEGEGDFQWLWTGPDKHSRLLIGCVDTRPATLKVTIVSEGCLGNGENLRVYINGVTREVSFDSWGNGSGRLSMTINRDDDNPLVLSILVPAMHEVGGRTLGVCIGAIELSRRVE